MILHLLMTSLSALAFVGHTVIEGNVRSFNDKDVEIVSEKMMLTVPRKLVPQAHLKSNQKLKVELSQEQWKFVKIGPVNK